MSEQPAATSGVVKTRLHLAKMMEMVGELVQATRALATAVEGEISPASTVDDLADGVIGLDVLLDGYEALGKLLTGIKGGVFAIAAEKFIETTTGSITRQGKTVYVQTDYWPSYRFEDLLPEGVDKNDDQYKATVAQCREAGKSRMILALKNDPELCLLVEEQVNANSLRSALTGEEVERDDEDIPVLPEALKDIVNLNPKNSIRVRKAAKR